MMDRSEMERQKAAEMRERSRDVLARTRSSDADDQSDSSKGSDSHWSVGDKVACHPNEMYGVTEEILEGPPKPILFTAAQVLNLSRTPSTCTTSSSNNNKDDKDRKGQPKEDPNEPFTAPADIGTGATTATSSNSHDRAIRKPGHGEKREQDIEKNLYVEDSLTPGAVRYVRGVINTSDSSRTFSQSSIVDDLKQPVADRAMATMPSGLHLVAELVPETDNFQSENERLREELQLEREERENTVVVVATSAKPMVEENNFTKRKTMIYRGIAVFFVVIGVAVGVAVGATAANKKTSPATSPTKATRFGLFLEALLEQDLGLEESVLTTSSTPQYEALDWLANEDKMDPETAPGRDILERFVLSTLYFATGGDNWGNQFKFLDERSVCQWNNGESPDSGPFAGILCNGSGHVANINMDENQIRGSIPTELWLLSDLVHINFGNKFQSSLRNYLSGTLPEDIGKLTALTLINFFSNSLSGTIPISMGALLALNSLDLSTNSLYGTIPTELGDLSALNHLFLGGNSFKGTIPTELGDLSALNTFELSRTFFLSGTIPTELGTLSALNSLELGFSPLTGAIPTELGTLLALTGLDLSFSSLSGTIPTELGALSALNGLHLTANSLSGTIPTSMGALLGLNDLYLDSNPLSGTVPTELGALTKLTRLELHETSLTGDLNFLCTTDFEWLYFASNYCVEEEDGSFLTTCSCCTNQCDN